MNTTDYDKLFDQLSPAEVEIFCEFKLQNNEKARKMQIAFARRLSEMYRTGVEGKLAKDRMQAAYYEALASEQEEKFKRDWMTTTRFYTAYRIYDRCRLMILRLYHVVSSSNNPLMNVLHDPLGIVTLIGSGSRLVIDLGLCLRPLFGRRRADENDLSFKEILYKRLTQVRDKWNKGQRRKRVLNDALWFSVNLISLVLAVPTGGISVIITQSLLIAAYWYDVWAEKSKYVGGKKVYDTKQLEQKMKKLAEDEAIELQTLIRQKEETIGQLDLQAANYQADKKALEESLSDLKKNPKIFDGIHSEATQALAKEKWHNRYDVTMTVLIAIGMSVGLGCGIALLFFPPTTVIGVLTLAGFALVLGSGSVLSGFGMEVKALFSPIFKYIAEVLSPVTKPIASAVSTLWKGLKNVFTSPALLSEAKTNTQEEAALLLSETTGFLAKTSDESVLVMETETPLDSTQVIFNELTFDSDDEDETHSLSVEARANRMLEEVKPTQIHFQVSSPLPINKIHPTDALENSYANEKNLAWLMSNYEENIAPVDSATESEGKVIDFSPANAISNLGLHARSSTQLNTPSSLLVTPEPTRILESPEDASSLKESDITLPEPSIFSYSN